MADFLVFPSSNHGTLPQAEELFIAKCSHTAAPFQRSSIDKMIGKCSKLRYRQLDYPASVLRDWTQAAVPNVFICVVRNSPCDCGLVCICCSRLIALPVERHLRLSYMHL